jgi:hypothetical protein
MNRIGVLTWWRLMQRPSPLSLSLMFRTALAVQGSLRRATSTAPGRSEIPLRLGKEATDLVLATCRKRHQLIDYRARGEHSAFTARIRRLFR